MIDTEDVSEVHKIQGELVTLYENDFSKHSGKVNSGRILLVFRSIVTQLAKENSKFVYGCVKEGARAREFEEAIEWLVSAGIVLRVYNVSKVEHPLKKDYEFSGALTENYVVQQLQQVFEVEPHYYSDSSQEEIDIVLQNQMDIIVGEIKAGESIKSNAFKMYLRKNQCNKALRYSQLSYRQDGAICNIPLYLIGRTKELFWVW